MADAFWIFIGAIFMFIIIAGIAGVCKPPKTREDNSRRY